VTAIGTIDVTAVHAALPAGADDVPWKPTDGHILSLPPVTKHVAEGVSEGRSQRRLLWEPNTSQ
jgi:hypothetical protein